MRVQQWASTIGRYTCQRNAPSAIYTSTQPAFNKGDLCKVKALLILSGTKFSIESLVKVLSSKYALLSSWYSSWVLNACLNSTGFRHSHQRWSTFKICFFLASLVELSNQDRCFQGVGVSKMGRFSLRAERNSIYITSVCQDHQSSTCPGWRHKTPKGAWLNLVRTP